MTGERIFFTNANMIMPFQIPNHKANQLHNWENAKKFWGWKFLNADKRNHRKYKQIKRYTGIHGLEDWT